MKWIVAFMLLSLSMVTRAQTIEYVHTDPLGSPVAITNQTGQVIERMQYEPYGANIGQINSDRPAYTGHVMDSQSGLTYMQQRYYDSGIGAMLSVDPVTAYDKGDMRFFNRYAYAFNNPYRFNDPDGRCPACDRFGDAFAKNPNAFRAFEPVAIQLTATALAITPVIGPILTLSFRGLIKNSEAPVANAPGGEKTHTTYTRAKEDGTVYSGRTSGKGTPEQQVAARTRGPDHQAKTREGYGPAVVDKNSPNANAIRGREQQLIEQNGGAQSQGGTSGNKINGVSPKNRNAETYRAACKAEFGC